MLNGLSTKRCVLSSVMLLGVGAGCVDAPGAFDDFANRVIDAGVVVTTDRPVLDEIPDITGEFLFSSQPPLGKEVRIIRLASVTTFTSNDDGTGALVISATPLTSALWDPSGEDVGDPIVANGITVDSNGTFSTRFMGQIPGPANPVIPGSAAPLDVVLSGQIRSVDVWCGTIDGRAGSLDLNDVPFAAIRITPGTRGDALPEPVVKCPEDTLPIDAGVPDAGVDAAADAAIDAAI